VQLTLGAFLAFIAGCFLLGAADDRRLARAGLALLLAGAFVVELNDPTADLAHSGPPTSPTAACRGCGSSSRSRGAPATCSPGSSGVQAVVFAYESGLIAPGEE
jgi:hypothetical protein